MRAKTEVDMFFKSKAPEKDKNATANAAEVMERTVQPHDQAWARSEPTKAGTASCIGSDMSIVGKIECKGPEQAHPGHIATRPAQEAFALLTEVLAPADKCELEAAE